jgi:hypothetical protein
MNERKLTKSELAKREDIIMKMKKNKRALTQKYGKDAEAVMYGRATNLAKKQAESMDQDKIKELVKDALQNPKKADLNKDGKLSDYEKKRGAAIEKNLDEMDLNDPIAMRLRADKMKAANAGDDGNDEFFRKNAIRLRKLKALKDKRAQIMRDMEQEAEMEGGPIADRYGDMLNKLDQAIAMLSEDNLSEGFYGSSDIEDVTNALGYSDVYEFFQDNPGAIDAVMDWVESIPEFGKMLRDADLLQEGASTEEKRIAMRAIKSIAKYRGVSNDEARNDLVRAAKEIGDLKEDLDLGHQDDEPHMLKADLYRIGKYAMELYQMVDRFEEGSEEVDFPHWWQSKVIKAKDMLVSAKHYLDFEIKEPQIDAMVDVAAEEDVVEEPLKEGVWSLGSANEIKDAIHTLEMWYELDARQISALFDDKDNSNFFYNIVGDDLFHDYLNRVEAAAAVDDADKAHNNVGDAIGRAEELLAFVQKREGLNEEDPGEADMVASDIQKAMNKHKKDDVKMYQLQKARTAMNKGDLDKAKKIAARLAEKLKSE